MKAIRILSALLAAVMIFTGATVLAAGTADDPLVTKSFLKDVLNRPLEDYIEAVTDTFRASLDAKSEGAEQAAESYARKQLAAHYADILQERVELRAAEKLAEHPVPVLTEGMKERTVYRGERITGPAGAAVMFVTGKGKVCGPEGSEILNATTGSTRKPGPAIREGILYMMLADDGSGIEVTSDSARVLVRDGARAGYEVQYERCADALRSLGLFLGTENGYELNRAPKRLESLIMLIRLLGGDQAALAFTDQSHFTDLSAWKEGRQYAAYGYAMGYTTGSGPSTFSPDAPSSAEQYLTFVLRSLGYQDGVDFLWDSTCRDLAMQLGLITRQELDAIARDGFRRDHVALLSYRALSCPRKDGTGTLGDQLVLLGVVTPEALELAKTFF